MSELVQGNRIGGRYVLEQRLGLGGMGEVWLAELEGAGLFRRRVVVKLLAPDRRGDARLAAMLADEARLVALLHHPGIVSAVDYLETVEHGPVFVLEFVDGPSLRSALGHGRRRKVFLPEPLASHIGIQVAHALDAAHNARNRRGEFLHVVHRDVCPDNVLLSRCGGVYLGDFGVARAVSHAFSTDEGEGPKGKRGYMAPEQALGEESLGPTADVFALGKVILEAADPNCRALRKVLKKATAANAGDRFQTAADFAAAMAAACSPPLEPQSALGAWLAEAAPEMLVFRRPAPGESVRSTPPPAGIPVNGDRPPLFAAVPPPRRLGLKIAATTGALLMLVVPLALIFGVRPSNARALFGAFAAGTPPHGDLKVESRPTESEVYVDGQLRGTTPLLVELPPGPHAVRVGSTRLGKWRAAQVTVRPNVEHRMKIDLSE